MSAPASELRFQRLYGRYHPDILAYFARRIGRDQAPDAADDVFAVGIMATGINTPEMESRLVVWRSGDGRQWDEITLASSGAEFAASPVAVVASTMDPPGIAWTMATSPPM